MEEIGKKLKLLLGVNTSIEDVANKMRLTLDTHSLVLGKAVDRFTMSQNNTELFVATKYHATGQKKVDDFIVALEYSKDKYATSALEKRTLAVVINRIKKEYVQ